MFIGDVTGIQAALSLYHLPLDVQPAYYLQNHGTRNACYHSASGTVRPRRLLRNCSLLARSEPSGRCRYVRNDLVYKSASAENVSGAGVRSPQPIPAFPFILFALIVSRRITAQRKSWRGRRAVTIGHL